MAAANGHNEVLKIIFEYLSSRPTLKRELLDGKNCDGNTPLRTHLLIVDYATICGQKEVVELLLKESADPNVTNECGRTALREAELLNNFEIGVIRE